MSTPSTGASPTDLPGIHVGPDPEEWLEDAVRAGGGRVVGADEADAIVVNSGGGDPSRVAALITGRTRWVQLPSAGIESWIEAGVITDDAVWTSAAGAYGPQVAEHALALLLAGARRLQVAEGARTLGGSRSDSRPDHHRAARRRLDDRTMTPLAKQAGASLPGVSGREEGVGPEPGSRDRADGISTLDDVPATR